MRAMGVGAAAAGMLGLGVAGVAGLAGGCAGYASYPNADGSLTRTTTSSRNTRAVMRESLAWVINRDTQRPARFAVNLPPSTGEEAYREIAAAVGGEPLNESNADLPRYSVGRVWVRAGEAKVDVTRPVMALGTTADGRYATQTLTVELEGGFTPWRVVRHRPWALGAIGEPPANPIGWSSNQAVADAGWDEPAPDEASGFEEGFDDGMGSASGDGSSGGPGGFEGGSSGEGARADAEPDVIEIVPE